MSVVHERSAECQQQDAAGHDDQCVREKLCAGVMLDVVPSTLERCEHIDEHQGKHEEKYQVNADIVPRGVVIRYTFVQHLFQKKSAKIVIFPKLRFEKMQNITFLYRRWSRLVL